jgi:hypothetical protein
VDFVLSAEQRELTEAAADFARRELNRYLMTREDAGEFPREAWQACAKFPSNRRSPLWPLETEAKSGLSWIGTG